MIKNAIWSIILQKINTLDDRKSSVQVWIFGHFMIQRFRKKQIDTLSKQFPVIAIIGPRQSGKTTLTKLLYMQGAKKAWYFDLESSVDRARFNHPEYFLDSFPGETIIIDEVQRLPELFALLRSMVDRNKKPGNYILLGSASPHLIAGVSETLAGRIAYVEVDPFNLTEVYKKQSDVNRHWLKGGFPDAWLSKNDQQWHAWMDNFFRTFIERDLNTLFGVSFSSELMYRLWRMLAHFHGGVWNAQSFAKGLDVSPTTVNKYIDYLEGAFMVRRLPAWFTNAKKRLVKSPKVYIRDSGLLHFLTDIQSVRELPFNPSVGNAWEGYVLEQILQLLPSTVKPYYYRTHDGSEMDLVLVRGIRPIACIEIKTTNEPTLSRGFYESLADLKCNKGFVITPYQEFSYNIHENVVIAGIQEFLNKKLPAIIKNK